MNKINVSDALGSSASLGVMDPVVNMKVRHGINDYWIVALGAGNATVSLAFSQGGTAVRTAYTFELYIDVTQATTFGWPNGSDCVKDGHAGIFPNGVPVIVSNGMVYSGGDGTTHSFSR